MRTLIALATGALTPASWVQVTDWGRCESRHQRARAEEALGGKRPLTGWEEGGKCKLPDFAWHDWGKVQVRQRIHGHCRAQGVGWVSCLQLGDMRSLDGQLRLTPTYRILEACHPFADSRSIDTD